ncbi:hypothetical protein DF22_002042 [Xylella fastidiosa]|nr:hypothetical protein DF22_002042 [Xylella fastidiosa]MDS9989081.1 hypothetical protein [Xylella fastidiosa]
MTPASFDAWVEVNGSCQRESLRCGAILWCVHCVRAASVSAVDGGVLLRETDSLCITMV